MARVLVIEDEENLRFSIVQSLRQAGHEPGEADSAARAWDATRASEYDAVITDIHLGAENGIDLVRRLREDGFEGGIVVMTAYGSVESAVAAMKVGADDYVQKPLSLEELVLLTGRLLEHRRVRRRLSLYERLESARSARSGPIGQSPAWRQTLDLATRLAAAPIMPRTTATGLAGRSLPTILLLGETGVGKGVLARYIHDRGAPDGQPAGPFVHVNCSALPPSLVESELFGHEKGAFTDAKSQRPGLFEMAEGGTIFLDEIGDMPLSLQAKVLTIVEDGTFRRVGSSKDRSASARIIAATNQDLARRVEEGAFRRDLLYRLNALTIRIPALRHRGADAALIAESVLSRLAREYGRPGLAFGDAARDALIAYAWPGNVRELINTVQRVAMLCDGNEVRPADLALGGAPDPTVAEAAAGGGGLPGALTFDFENGVHHAEDVERELIVQALRATRGNVSRAAKLIGMQRSSLRYRIDRFGLEPVVQEMASR
ncbi:MAG: sigma-54-dependent transcriptional regulator [Phycisphaerales bacterium]